MGCCGGSSSTADAPTPHTFFFKKRGCTDLCCLIFFLAFWVGIIYIAYLAMTVGDMYAVFYGSDYLGNRCGVGTMSDKPKVYYPRIDQDIIAQAAIATTMPWRLAFYGLCMPACPNITTPEACFADPASCQVLDYGTPAEYTAAGGRASYFATMPSVDFLNRCVPTDSSSLTQEPDRCAFPQCDGVTFAPCDTEYPTTWTMSFPASLQCEVLLRQGTIKQLRPAAVSTLTEQLAGNVATLETVVRSLTASSTELLIFGIAMPVVLGFVWLVLLRLFAGIFTYIMITLIGAGLLLLSLYLWVRAGAVDALMDALNGNTTLTAGLNVSDEMAAAMNNSLYQALGLISTAQDAVASLAPSDLTSAAATAQNEVPALWFILAILMSVITLVYIISICAARKKIKTAIALVKESANVIKDRPMTMFFPFNVLVSNLLVALLFLLIFLTLQTATITSAHFGAISDAMTATTSFIDSIQLYNSTLNSGGVQSLEDLDNSSFYITLIMYVYLLFGLLWTIASFSNISWTAMSGNVSHWYFFRGDDEDAKAAKTRVPLLRSLGRVVRYHLGSIFFGAFIISVIQLIRIILYAIDRYTKKQQDANFLLKLAIKCTQCCMWCFEKTIKFITNYCYIYVAMQGASFCKACFLTFSLIVNNPAQLSINTFVRTILSWIQLLGLPIACGWLCNFILIQSARAETIWPTVVVGLSSYVIASTFTSVFSCVLDTLFVCCCRDRAEYKGQYMPNRLRTVFGFGKKMKKSKAEEEEEADEAGEDA